MALFGRNKKEEEKKEAPKTAVKKEQKAKSVSAAPATSTSIRGLSHVLRNPRITEKASLVQGAGVYTFDVATSASKRQIAEAVRALYNVTPRKVAVVTIPEKKRRNVRTGKLGVSRGGRKAYVYLKQGDTIAVH